MITFAKLVRPRWSCKYLGLCNYVRLKILGRDIKKRGYYTAPRV
nr:MAG TPA: hypothetical protein [Caudoviricetes sp.]